MKNGVITADDFRDDKAYISKDTWKKVSITPVFTDKPIEVAIDDTEDLAYKYAMTSVMIQGAGRGGYFADTSQDSKLFAIKRLIEDHKSLKEELFTLKFKEQQRIEDFESHPRWKKRIIRKMFEILGVRHVRYDE